MVDEKDKGQPRIKLGELLVRENLITPAQLQTALTQHTKTKERLGIILVRDGVISEAELIKALSEKWGVPCVDLKTLDIDPEVIKLVKKEIAERFRVIPINRAAGTIVIAVTDPSDLHIQDIMGFSSGYKVEIVVAGEKDITDAIAKYYDSTSDALNRVISEIGDSDIVLSQEQEQEPDAESLKTASEDAPVVKFVNSLLADAISRNASDIHLEPYEKSFRIRYRIDGVLYEIKAPPFKLKDAITSRIKIMAELDISQRRLPQDGRIKIKLTQGREMDFRVSVYPTLFGEKIVLRLLDKSNLQLDMTKLGFDEQQFEFFKSAIHRPYGMVLVTGPTGSGKTTTLYSALSELNQADTNIMTAEDPVEFNLPGINQGQMHEDIGLTFAASLRSFLRQDPDIIMVGEIRDFETAEIAVKAALTGHMVLSTLHTNDATSTINRLLNMGVEPFLVASSVNLVVAQRLVRKVCSQCKESINASTQALLDIQVPEDEIADYQLMKGKGCQTCNDSGYKGRIALYEVLVVGPEVQEYILHGASSVEIKRAAMRLGMKSMRQSGLAKLKAGVTTIEEVVRSSAAD
ncbi:MAG: type IV-A pilus assembly ATPase PilB [Candidatus Parcubacteria bacterium]|nr:type IV-A pilus assembly ATPase PilB [Candidatus Parcubacteria bacterium]